MPISPIKMSTLIFIGLIGICALLLGLQKQQGTANAVLASSTSPFICGANINYNLTSNMSGAKQLHVQTIRMGDGPNYASDLQKIQNAGFQPLVILHGCSITDP